MYYYYYAVSEEINHSLSQEISVDEVQKDVASLKSGKACGLDHIHAEMLKTGRKDVVLFMTKLFNTIFDKGIYPSDWAKAIIVPIHKKGDIHLADNYRGVSLLSIVSKCYTSILNTRLYNWLEENDKIVEMQVGFRRNYSTTDQIFNLYAVAQKCLNKVRSYILLLWTSKRPSNLCTTINCCKLCKKRESKGNSLPL